MRWSPEGWTAKLEMTEEPDISFLASSCFARLYIRTLFWVATKKKGFVGWKAALTTFPLFFLKGFWVAFLLSWCTSTA